MFPKGNQGIIALLLPFPYSGAVYALKEEIGIEKCLPKIVEKGMIMETKVT
jgi:hypothetical protein